MQIKTLRPCSEPTLLPEEGLKQVLPPQETFCTERSVARGQEPFVGSCLARHKDPCFWETVIECNGSLRQGIE